MEIRPRVKKDTVRAEFGMRKNVSTTLVIYVTLIKNQYFPFLSTPPTSLVVS